MVTYFIVEDDSGKFSVMYEDMETGKDPTPVKNMQHVSKETAEKYVERHNSYQGNS